MTTPEIKAPQSFSWGRLIVETKMSGLTAMIACHCEPTHYNADMPFLRLEIPGSLDGLKSSPAMDTFQQSLKGYFGPELQLEFVHGPALKSPAGLSQAKRLMSMVSAYEAIMSDDLVKSMVKDFGARVLVDTVKPSGSGPRP